MPNEDFNAYFRRVVNAYRNFIGFLRDDNVVIDYTYLWDIVCKPGGLFKNGFGPEDDITSRIELICPTNQYSIDTYDVNRRILILYSRNGFFEPIYRYSRIKKTVYDVRKLFYHRHW